MNVGILIIGKNDYFSDSEFDIDIISKELSYKGYDVKAVVQVNANSDLNLTDTYLKSVSNAIIVCGQTEFFYEYLSENYAIIKDLGVLEIEETIYAFMESFDINFIVNSVIPTLNSKSKTYYNTVVFKTVGKTEEQLREILKDYLRNKNRITFRFIENLPECEVQIKFSSKTQKIAVDGTISAVSSLLSDITYATKDTSLVDEVAENLKLRGKKICISESFTGGAIAAELVKIPGISAVLKEGIVAYSNEAKCNRLKVNPNIISTYGAVSIETVYEMAANQLLENPDCDICLATTGNAGPSAEKDGQQGLCFIAIGNKNGIHIYKHNFTGDRQTNIKYGTIHALFHLNKKLNESEFVELLKIHEQNNK